MKRIFTVLCLVLVCVALCSCGKDDEPVATPSPTPVATAGADEGIEEGIEFGGEIDDSGEIVMPENEGDNSEADSSVEVQEMLEPVVPELELEYGADGNITKQSAVLVLQQYTSEQLGLTPNVGHQLLFDPDTAEVNGKKCYVIAAKLPEADTEGVFYVSLDGKEAYKYDVDNQQYIKLP